MKFVVRKNSGFSITEMMVASVIVIFLSGMTYRVLSTQNRTQKDSLYGDKQNNQALKALDRIKSDLNQVEFNLTKYDVPPVFAHQGLGLGVNSYVSTLMQSEGVNDGITILTRDVGKVALNSLKFDAQFPAATSPARLLYGADLPLLESSSSISVGDWVILFQAEKYALGVVTATGTASSDPYIRIRQPNSTETLMTHLNTAVSRSSGYVTKEGVVPASYDMTGTDTAAATDNSITLGATVTKVQVIHPVSYHLDYATNDGLPHGNGNSYLLDQDGKQKKVVVRTEYLGVSPFTKREYLAEADLMGFTYDVLASSNGAGSLTGLTTSGSVVKNIGRDKNSTMQFVNLSIGPNSINLSGDAFKATSRIVAVKVILGSDSEDGQKKDLKMNEVHVALDTSRVNNQFQKESRVSAMNSPNMADPNNMVSGYAPSGSGLRIFSPAYLRKKDPSRDFVGSNQAYTAGSGSVDVVVPIGTVDPVLVGNQNGALAVLDEAGAPATNTVSCTGTPCCTGVGCEKIKFGFGSSSNKYFYPTTVIQKPAEGSETLNKMYIGGLGVDRSGSNIIRKPMMAEISYPKGMTFREFVKKNNVYTNFSSGYWGNHCSLGGACELKEILPGAYPLGNMGNKIISGSNSGTADAARLKDVSSLAIDDTTGSVYMSSVTRTQGNDSTLSIYRKNNVGTIDEIVVDNTLGYATNRVVGAIAAPIEINGQRYLPIATSRSINSSAQTEDGQILLHNLTTPSNPPIVLASHNFKANSLVSIDGGLLIGGKMVVQGMNGDTIAARVSGAITAPVKFFLDELASYNPSTGVKEYADAYFTLPSAYTSASPTYSYSNPTGITSNAAVYQNILGWNTGINATKISEMEYGLVIGNQVLVDNGGDQREIQDFTTMSINFGGMSERVIATIKPYPNNLQASEVVVKYDKQKKAIPSVFLPGVLFAKNAPNTRMTQFALPLLSAIPNLPTSPSVSQIQDNEDAWVDFYKEYHNIQNGNNGIDYIPDPTVAQFQCSNSSPPTCGMTGGHIGDEGAGGSAGGVSIGTGTATAATATAGTGSGSSN